MIGGRDSARNVAGVSGALLGLTFFLAVYGASIVDPLRIDWLLHGDPAQHYLGFAFFRHGGWGWPLGAVPDLGAPLGTTLVFSDSIPLLAIPFKLLSAGLPADFQYFGFWMLLCHVLHGAFAERLLARLGVDGPGRLAAVLLLLTSPALALRAYGHESLMAHWLILASFDAYLAGEPRRQGPLLGVAALIHAYWLVMLLPFVLLAWRRQEAGWRPCLAWLGGVALAMALAGYFVARPGQLAAEGYGSYSANLLTFLDPMDWAGFLHHYGRSPENAGEWSRLLPALGQADPGQYEGFAYLGAGVLGLLAAGVAALAMRGGNAFSSARLGPLFGIALLLFVYALSARVSFGETVLAAPALPPLLLDVLSVFRSTGRFVWPLALLLPLWAVVVLADRAPRRMLGLLLALLAALQCFDLSDKWGEFHRRFAPGGIGSLPEYVEPAWESAARASRLVVLSRPDAADDWIAPALFAARHGLSVNAAYLARSDVEAVRQAEKRAISELVGMSPRPDTAYWVRDPRLAAALPDELCARWRCEPLRGGVMVTAR